MIFCPPWMTIRWRRITTTLLSKCRCQWRHGIARQQESFNPLRLRRVKVIAFDREVAWDEEDGILCVSHRRGRGGCAPNGLGIRRSDPNYQLVDDFAAWFFGELSEDEDDELEDDEDVGRGRRS